MSPRDHRVYAGAHGRLVEETVGPATRCQIALDQAESDARQLQVYALYDREIAAAEGAYDAAVDRIREWSPQRRR